MNIGETLQSRRIKLGLSFERVRKETRISIAFLKALEENKFKDFPAELYMVGALQKYSAYLGLDAEVLLKQIHLQGVLKAHPVRKPFKEDKSAVDGDRENKIHENMVLFSEAIARSFAFLVVITLVLGAVLYTFGWYTGRMYKSKKQSKDAVYSKHRFFKAGRSRGYDLPDKLVLYLKAKERMWLQLKDSDKLRFEGFLPENREIEFTTANFFELFMEKPELASITLNGLVVQTKELYAGKLHAAKLTKEYFRQLRRIDTLRGKKR